MSTPDPPFIELVRRHLKYLKSGEPLEPDSALKSLGLESMASLELLLDLEETYGVVVSDRYLTEETFSTAGALWRVVTLLSGEFGKDQ